jgi:UDP-N-acetylglucosamine--N-acetylmuramyl-(pentapeptide) pyrophosphoryl-undecaprenol N-acetylglucosamine transferase
LADVRPALSVVIAAGGTGGHIYPGLALADALRRLRPDVRVTFVGTRRGLEGTIVPGAGYPLELVDMIPFTPTLGARRFLLPVALVRAAAQARRILRDQDASVAVGMGGYASIPVVVAAWLGRVPALIHESGAVPGRANLVAARFTRHVAVAFEEAAAHFPRSARARTVGMPLGPDLAAFDRSVLRAEARAAFALPDGVTALLVNGGSQGSARLNELAVGLAARWRDRGDVRIVLKAGRAHHEQVTAALAANGGAAVTQVVEFFARMDHAYAAADLAICRAGAATVAELAVTGLPAVLVPYPWAPRDHQARNAETLVRAGGARLVRDAEATVERVAPLVEELLADPARRDVMGKAIREVAHPRAADELARWVLELAA